MKNGFEKNAVPAFREWYENHYEEMLDRADANIIEEFCEWLDTYTESTYNEED